MWLTLSTFVGYAIVYTVLLKPGHAAEHRDRRRIRIDAATAGVGGDEENSVTPEALILFLIIFAWTPPHFWSLALYRTQDYARAGLPMLPVTHGSRYTRLMIVLYTFVLVAVSCLPYAIRMSGLLYLAVALALGAVYLGYAWRLYRNYSDALARKAFRYSIVYLSALFAALLLDHYL